MQLQKQTGQTHKIRNLAICAIVSIWLPIKLQLYCDRQLACQACGVLMTNTLFLKRFLPVNRRLGARRYRIEESAFKDLFISIAGRSSVGLHLAIGWIKYRNKNNVLYQNRRLIELLRHPSICYTSSQYKSVTVYFFHSYWLTIEL